MQPIWEFLWPECLYLYPGRWHLSVDQYCPGLQDSLGGLVDRSIQAKRGSTESSEIEVGVTRL